MFKLTGATAGAWPSEQGEAVPCHCIHHPANLSLRAIRPQQALCPATQIGLAQAPLLRHGSQGAAGWPLDTLPPELTSDSREVALYWNSFHLCPVARTPPFPPGVPDYTVALETQPLICVASQAAFSSLGL